MTHKKKKVLILEDVKSDVDLIFLHLEEFDFDFRVTDNKEDFEKSLQEFDPDIVLSDYNLPSYSGFNALEALKSTSKNIPFIFVTGTLGEETAVDSIKSGATDFIVKERIVNLPAAIMRAFREQEEKRLRTKKEAHFKAIIENSKDPVLLFDENGTINYASPAVFTTLGYEVNEFIRKKINKIIHPDDLKIHETAFKELFLLKKSLTQVTLRVICKNGNEKYVEAIISDQRDIPDVNCFSCNFRDVHEETIVKRKIEQQQELLRETTSLARFGNWKMDVTFKNIFWSETMKDLYEVDHHFEPTYHSMLNFFEEGENREKIKTSISTTIHHNIPYDVEVKMITAKGNKQWVRAIGKTTISENGTKELRGSIQDITPIKEAQLKQLSLTVNLEEKIREQRVLSKVSKLLQDNKKPIEKVFQNILELIPLGWNEPNNISVKITFEGKDYLHPVSNNNFDWSVNEAFGRKNQHQAQLYIGFKHEYSINQQTGKKMLQALSGLLSTWLEKRHAETELNHTLENLEKIVVERTIELQNTYKKLTTAHKHITDSINYAQYIQQAVLPSASVFNQAFEDSFVLYLPKDVVSGDFYWIKQIEGKICIACADCTGHGVPGALMSMIGNELLENIIMGQKITSPDLVLEAIHRGLIRLLKKDQSSHYLNDGMDISLCIIDRENRKLSFAGVFNNAYLFHDSECITLKSDRIALGSIDTKKEVKFNKTEMLYTTGDLLYMFTDGYQDQFGGPDTKKIMRKNLLSLLDKIHQRSMSNQKEILSDTFYSWKGDGFQVDDVTVMGVIL